MELRRSAVITEPEHREKKMLAGSAGGSVKMRNKRHRNNFIKVDGFIEYGKKRIFVVIKFILAIG